MGSVGHSQWQRSNQQFDYDVLIIGAGLSGIYSLHRLRGLGLRVKVLEAGSGEGGTWFWNRYPGARFDSESYSYNFFFSQELLDEWNWSEHFAPQPETLEYCRFVTDRLDLRKDMQFNTCVKKAKYRQETRSWLLIDENDHQYSSRFLVTAMGMLSEPTYPNIPGVARFEGISMHTSRWPDDVSLDGKRVGIIGTGATGIQTITEIAKTVEHLTVFQRTPNWSAPLHNARISQDEMEQIRSQYPEILKICNESYACFMHTADKRKTFDVPAEEREAFWEELYMRRGFAKWVANFADYGFDREANKAYSDFHANKIRHRINDPAIADKLIPKDHGFGTKRVPLESGYFEVFNQSNVTLKDIHEDPIEEITETGIKTGNEVFELDALIYATGFDAVTGAFTAIDFQGLDNRSISEEWKDGPRTQLGIFVHNFPNMMMVLGPHQMFGNIPRSIEYAVDWITNFVRHCEENNITSVEATKHGVDEWTTHVFQCAEGLLSNEVDSWMTGINKNLKHKQTRVISRYNGPASGYRQKTGDVANNGFRELRLS